MSQNPSTHQCVQTGTCPEPHISNAALPSPAPADCISYVTIFPDVQGLGHAHANRDTALQVALALADIGVCYAHPPIKARHVHDPKKWEHFLGFEKGFHFQGTVLHNASFQQVCAVWFPARTPLSPLSVCVTSAPWGCRAMAMIGRISSSSSSSCVFGGWGGGTCLGALECALHRLVTRCRAL